MSPTPDKLATVDDASFVAEINDLLVSTYASIEALEGQLITRGTKLDVSVSESRLLDVVGRETFHGAGELSVSSIAEALGVKVPSATSAVNRLVSKGLLKKERNARDARRVNVTLTREGERLYRLHMIFHRNMAAAIAGDMTPEERALLLDGVRRLERFYAQAREA